MTWSTTTVNILLSIVKLVCWSSRKLGWESVVKPIRLVELRVLHSCLLVLAYLLSALVPTAFGRLVSDIGMVGRKDVKVPVERLVAMSSPRITADKCYIL